MIATVLHTFSAFVLIGVLVIGPSVVLVGGILFALLAGTPSGREMGLVSNHQDTTDKN